MAEWRIFTRTDWQEAGLEVFRTTKARCAGDGDDPPCLLGSRRQLRTALDQLKFRLFQDQGRSVFEHGAPSGPESKIPRAHKWRSYRLSSRGQLLALVTLKHSEAFNLCEVDVCLAVQACREDQQAARSILQLLLCDAAKCGGSMAIQFTAKCAGGLAPDFVAGLAKSLGIELSHASRGTIAPNESRDLF